MAGFKNFVLRGNLVEIAVGLIMAVAFAAVISTFVAWLTALLPESASEIFSNVPNSFGAFLNAVVTFLLIGAVVYFFVVMPYTRAKEKFSPPRTPARRPTSRCWRRSATCSRRAASEVSCLRPRRYDVTRSLDGVAGRGLTHNIRGLPSRGRLLGLSDICGRPRCSPSVRALGSTCTHDLSLPQRSMASRASSYRQNSPLHTSTSGPG